MVDFNQKIWKFAGGLVVILGISLVIWSVSVLLDPEAREARQARAYLENLQEQYENDIYGGETPEETLALFIDALEAGDIELASKYFLPDDREKWAENISGVKTSGNLKDMIEDISRAEKSKQENDQALFVVTDDTNTVSVLISLGKNSITGVWKITNL